MKSKRARATLVASWKNPRENKETKAHKESFVDLRSFSPLSFRPFLQWHEAVIALKWTWVTQEPSFPYAE